MSAKPDKPEDLLAMPAPAEPEAVPMTGPAWESWDESPVFNDDEMYDALNGPRRWMNAKEVLAVKPAETPAPPAPSSLAGQIEATPAPAVGVIGVDLTLHGASLSAALRAFSGAGPTLVTLAREQIGRYVATIQRPGGRYAAPQAFTPPLGDPRAAQRDVIRWLRDVVVGVAQAAVPTILIVSDGCDLASEVLESIAREAPCVVALLDHRGDVSRPEWEPKLLKAIERKAARVAAAPAARSRRPDRVTASDNAALAWLEGVADLVVSRPENIAGPAGEPIAVSHGLRDSEGREHVALRGTMDRDGRLRPMELEIASGVFVDLSDLRVLT